MIQRVRSGLIDTNAVTGDKIVAGTVTGNLIGVSAVSSNHIANSAVTNAKLAEPNAFEDYFLLGSL